MFYAILVTADRGHLGTPNCQKKKKKASCKEHSGTELDQFQSRVLEDLLYSHHFMQIFYFAQTQ